MKYVYMETRIKPLFFKPPGKATVITTYIGYVTGNFYEHIDCSFVWYLQIDKISGSFGKKYPQNCGYHGNKTSMPMEINQITLWTSRTI